ncbi:hypothetical protein ACFQ0B_80580 [Nonomuraea thailandensis]
MEISWSPATGDNGVSRYEVYRSLFDPTPGSTDTVLVGTVTGLSIVDSGLAASRYNCRIRAVDTSSQPGALSVNIASQATLCAPTDCLAAAYGMRTSSSTGELVDESGHGNHGTLSGVVTTADGRHGLGFEFGPSAGEIIIPNSESLTLDTAATLEAWVYPTDITNRRPILVKAGPDIYTSSYELYAVSANDNQPPAGPGILLNSYGSQMGLVLQSCFVI